ncbi:MAG: response regulator [Gammaproteobacteria bacterium]|nr:response regulator [Gammaproteobacteria bacterium]
MKGLLTQWGCEVIAVASSTEAVAHLKVDQSTIDLIIVDYRLPESLSGIDIARVLQAELGYPVGVLIVTGDTGPERLQEAESSGFPLLHKPVQPAKLRSTLQFLVNKTRLKIN